MPVVLHGNLKHFTAVEMLLLLGERAHTGTLDVESNGGRARLVFREGRLIWAEASGVSEPDKVVASVVGWRKGTFSFLEEVALPEGAAEVSLEIKPLVAAAEAQLAEAQKLSQLYPDSIVFRVVNRPEGHINLSPEQFQVLFQFAAGRPFAEVRDESKLPVSELYPIVQTLQTNGLIEMVPGAEKVPAKRRKTRAKTTDQKMIGTLTAYNGTMHPLMDDSALIGRMAPSDIILPDASVSSKHARVLRTSDGFVIEDLRSRNGTFVNGEQVTEKRLLADGDSVRLGKVILTFNLAVKATRHETTDGR